MTEQRLTYTPSSVAPFSRWPGQTPVGTGHQPQVGESIVPPLSVRHILGEGSAVFTDMTETMLTALDKQMAQPETVHEVCVLPCEYLA